MKTLCRTAEGSPRGGRSRATRMSFTAAPLTFAVALGLLAPGILLGGCRAPSAEGVVSQYETSVEEARSLVATHGDAVREAASLDEIEALETAYAGDWAEVRDGMAEHMDHVGACQMHSGGMPQMGGMEQAMGEMEAEIDAHLELQSLQADTGGCREVEVDHGSVMETHLDAMEAGDWAGMTCPGMNGM